MGIIDTKTDYFGLDIGTTGVRMVKLKAGSTVPTLVTYGAAETPSDLINSDSQIDHDKMAGIVKQLKDQAHISTDEVVTSIPSVHAFTTVITTPKLNSSDLAKAIKLQADQYIPMPIDEAKLDWHVINPDKSESEMSVLLVAAPRNMVDKYLSIVEKAGLNLLALEINALATARSVISTPELPVVVLDFGSTNTEISVVWQGVPHLVRSINVGGASLVRSVAQNLNIDEDQASQFLQKFGLTQTKLEGQVYKAAKGSLDSVMSEVTKSIKFFASQNPGVNIEKVVLTGGPTALPEMPSYVANALNLPVEIANPWMNVSYPASQQDTLMGQSLQFAVAVGLAQRAFI